MKYKVKKNKMPGITVGFPTMTINENDKFALAA